jgi:hypothetical protein
MRLLLLSIALSGGLSGDQSTDMTKLRFSTGYSGFHGGLPQEITSEGKSAMRFPPQLPIGLMQ